MRSTPYQDPRVVVGGATIVIIAEYKEPDPAIYERGLKLFTVHVRRGDPGGAGPEDQLALQAQLHPRLDPGDAGRRRRSADARSARLRRDLQLDALLHRPQGRGVDVERQILPRRDHPRPGARDRARRRHSGDRKGFLADRRLRRRRGVRHRHLRRDRAGPRGRRTQARPAAGPMVERLQKLYAERVERDVAEQQRP